MNSQQHLVRVGVMGHVGLFSATDAVCYPRDSRVILRTPRGLELGHVLGRPANLPAAEEGSGKILRIMTPEDELLATRVEKNCRQAFEACSARLAEQDIAATLVDIELLFDGRSLFFYFLGEITPEIEALTAELAEVYETKVKFRKFTEVVINGCGPNCGTDDAEGGCSNCTSCAVSCSLQR
ncbi:MAG: PSP1 domain-containing protein [Planctomycetales bacterium]